MHRRWDDVRPPIRPKRREPTARQLVVFLAVLRLTTRAAAAKELGVSMLTVKSQMAAMFARIGAQSRAHAAWLLGPRYLDRMILPGDRRKRRRRR
jgi:DNA-binding NarL/FixJ family response regulator